MLCLLPLEGLLEDPADWLLVHELADFRVLLLAHDAFACICT